MSLCLQVLFKDDYFLLDPDTTYDDQDLADVNFTVNEYLAAGDDLNLQSDLLKTRWFGWDFYRKYLENAFDASYKRHRRWISKERRAQDESSSHSQPSNRQSIYEKKLEEPQRIDLEDEDLTVRKEPQYRWFRLLPNCRIPDKLLRAPFSHDQYTFLKTLILAGAVVDWYGTAAGELAEAALEYAIREASADLVRLLLHEAIGIPWQESYLEQAYREQARQSKHDFEPIIVQLTERRERDGHQNGGS
ncbi:MAG: hypothetical protein M1822_005311 [Bathelium mastoideum]|nr:MAG: hypothetical protein M1822_005311 [Bathelium mastoideum]